MVKRYFLWSWHSGSHLLHPDVHFMYREVKYEPYWISCCRAPITTISFFPPLLSWSKLLDIELFLSSTHSSSYLKELRFPGNRDLFKKNTHRGSHVGTDGLWKREVNHMFLRCQWVQNWWWLTNQILGHRTGNRFHSYYPICFSLSANLRHITNFVKLTCYNWKWNPTVLSIHSLCSGM